MTLAPLPLTCLDGVREPAKLATRAWWRTFEPILNNAPPGVLLAGYLY